MYEFKTYKNNFIENEHVKLDEACLDTQSQFKVYLSIVMDVLGHLTSKLLKTQHNAYKYYNNTFKDLITS